MSSIITINETPVKMGETAQINLNIARLPSNTVIDLPVFVYRAPVDGPTLLLTAGLHGDEINGIETIRRMIYKKMIAPTVGTVIAIPVVNIYGFIYNSRKLPDGKDLNRSFPGSTSGSLASRIAHIMMNEILPHVDLGIDFHTGGASKMNYPHLRCDISDARTLEIARAFDPPFIVNSKAPDHSFRKAATKVGKHILTFEGGESLRLHPFSIESATLGIRRLMQHLGMRNGNTAPPTTHILKGSWWNRAKSAGLFRSAVEIGQKISRRQVMGYIGDPFGAQNIPIKARADGYVIGINNLCVVNKGEALIHIGAEIVPPASQTAEHPETLLPTVT